MEGSYGVKSLVFLHYNEKGGEYDMMLMEGLARF